MRTALRYVLYLAYCAFAILFWLIVIVFVLPGGPLAAPAGPIAKAFGTIVIYAIMPLTALAFVFFRLWVRRLVGAESD